MTTACPAKVHTTSSALVSVASRRIARYLAALRLPPSPTLLVSGVVLDQTEQRARVALAAFEVLRTRGPSTVTILEREVRPVMAGVARAVRDLVAAGVVEGRGDGVWAARGGAL